MNLVVKSAFGEYKVGQPITDQVEITKILESANARHVLKVAELPVAQAIANPLFDLIKSQQANASSGLSSVSSVSSGFSATNSSVSSVSTSLSEISSGLSGANSSVSSISSGLSSVSSGLSDTNTSVSSVSSLSTVSTGNAS